MYSICRGVDFSFVALSIQSMSVFGIRGRFVIQYPYMSQHFLHNKRIVMIGNEGAGKGTQIHILQKQFRLPVVSVGVMLRDEIKQQTKMGKLLRSHVDSGRLAPNNLVNQLIEAKLKRYRNKGFILDGYPRDPEQIGFLLSLTKIDIVVGIIISREEIRKRILFRRVCEKGHIYHLKSFPPKTRGVCDRDGLPLIRRKDSTETAIRHREEVFRIHTSRVIRAFQNFGIYVEIDGHGTPQQVHARVVKALEGFQRCP